MVICMRCPCALASHHSLERTFRIILNNKNKCIHIAASTSISLCGLWLCVYFCWCLCRWLVLHTDSILSFTVCFFLSSPRIQLVGLRCCWILFSAVGFFPHITIVIGIGRVLYMYIYILHAHKSNANSRNYTLGWCDSLRWTLCSRFVIYILPPFPSAFLYLTCLSSSCTISYTFLYWRWICDAPLYVNTHMKCIRSSRFERRKIPKTQHQIIYIGVLCLVGSLSKRTQAKTNGFECVFGVLGVFLFAFEMFASYI